MKYKRKKGPFACSLLQPVHFRALSFVLPWIVALYNLWFALKLFFLLFLPKGRMFLSCLCKGTFPSLFFLSWSSTRLRTYDFHWPVYSFFSHSCFWLANSVLRDPFLSPPPLMGNKLLYQFGSLVSCRWR